MKIRRILSAATACVVAAAAMASVASADFVAITDGAKWLLADGTGNYGICLYSDGANKDGVPAMDIAELGVDIKDIAHVAFTFEPLDHDMWDGQGGGSIVLSTHTAEDTSTYNWVASGNFWGVNDEALEFTADDTQALQAQKVGDYLYKVEADVDMPVGKDANFENPSLVRVFMQAWSFIMSDIAVVSTELYDASGNLLITFDGKGNPTAANGGAAADTGNDAAADTGNATEGSETAPAGSDKKDSPDTGVEGVAVAAGLAAAAAGAVVLAKKRK